MIGQDNSPLIFFLLKSGKQKNTERLLQKINSDLLEKTNNDTSISDNKMIFSSYFITDNRNKLNNLIAKQYSKLN